MLHDLIPNKVQDEIHDEIHFALSEISEKEKISFLLFELGGFSLGEIMIIQNEKSISSVKSRLSRTRDKLKKIIESIESKKNKNKKYTGIGDIEIETSKIISNIKP